MQLQQLRAFREVARERNFTRAARNLHYAQSSVTAQVHKLEAFVGAPLFDRGGRLVALTEAGQSLLPYAESMLDLAEEARREVLAASVRPYARVPASGI